MSTDTHTYGPAAPGHLRQLWSYRELLRNLVERDIKVRYKRSVLGFAWMILNPLITIIFTILGWRVLRQSGRNGVTAAKDQA